MTAFLGKPKDITVRLLAGGSPVSGVTVDEVIFKLRKNGETAFSTRTLLESEWLDLEQGYYAICLTADDLDVLGDLRYSLSGADFDPVTEAFDVDPAPIAYETAAPQCIVSGNIVDIGGEPLQQTRVFFQPKNVPGKTGGSLIASGSVNLLTDHSGNFSAKLIRESSVLVIIPDAGIKVLIEVPDASSANLIDLLPPIPPVT